MTINDPTPRFSIIMPVYNHERWVGAAVDSVIAQTLTSWELIVVDDGSSDRSVAEVGRRADRDPRIRVVEQENAGPAAARNHALQYAKAPFLAYLDSDDLYYPETLAAFAEFFAAHPDAEFVHGFRDRLDEDGTVTKSEGEFQSTPSGARELFSRMYLSHLSVAYRKTVIDRVGGYDTRLRSCEDYDLYLRMSPTTTFFPLGRSTGLRRRHGTNLSRQTGFSRRLEAEVLKRFYTRLGGDRLVPEADARRRLFRLYYASGRQYLKAGFMRDARMMFETAHGYGRSPKSTLLAGVAAMFSFRTRRETRVLPNLERPPQAARAEESR